MENTKKEQKEKLKTLGQGIPEALYWEFKKVAAERHETMNEAVENAIRIYVSMKAEA